jgi:hypothetical protein
VGALLGALATLPTLTPASPQVREKDIRLDEDHVNRPGVITLNVAAELDDAAASQAIQLIEETRPVGVRVVHNLDSQTPSGENAAPSGLVSDDESDLSPDATATVGALYYPVTLRAVVLPASATLSPQERAALQTAATQAAQAFVAAAGVGETLVYNRLIGALMAIEGVLDVAIDLYPTPDPSAPGRPAPRHLNLRPPPTLRPTVDPKDKGVLDVRVGGELVRLDITVDVTLKGALATGDPIANQEDARVEISARLRDAIYGGGNVSQTTLKQAIGLSDHFVVDGVDYTVWYVEAGVKVDQPHPAITPSAEEVLWVRSVALGKVKVQPA